MSYLFFDRNFSNIFTFQDFITEFLFSFIISIGKTGFLFDILDFDCLQCVQLELLRPEVTANNLYPETDFWNKNPNR